MGDMTLRGDWAHDVLSIIRCIDWLCMYTCETLICGTHSYAIACIINFGNNTKWEGILPEPNDAYTP